MTVHIQSEDEVAAAELTDPRCLPSFDAVSVLLEIREDVIRLLSERPEDEALRHRVERTYWEIRKRFYELGVRDELIDALGDPIAAASPWPHSRVATVCS